LMRLQARRHLMEFVTDYQAPLIQSVKSAKGGLKILSLEQKLRLEHRVGDRPFHLKGKVDRTETRDGRLFVLDYKTSSNEKYYGVNFKKLDPEDRAKWNQAVSSLQLPFYTLLLSRIHNRPSADIHCCFVMLGKNRLGPKIEFSPYDEDDLDSRRGQIRTMEGLIDKLLLEVADPDVPFDPSSASDKTCGRCPYTAICGQR
jgi:hypothetical protein